VVLLLGGSVFADANTQSIVDASFINEILKLFSWIWVILAMWAGKLMTNEFVYGTFMNFDVYLRQMRNISKNFANLTIGFMFLYYILKFVFQSDEVTGNDIGKKIGWFLLASVLIQASWFITGALLDVEKIATSAMGALPWLIIQDDNSWWQHIVGSISDSVLNKKISFVPADGTIAWTKVDIEDASWVIDGQSTPPESILDSILPRHDNLAWPLYYIGFGMFKFHNYGNMELNQEINLLNMSRLLTSVGIKLLMVGAFVLMMFILFLVNIIRIGYLWLVISLAPLIVLYLVLKEVLGMSFGGSVEKILDKINLPTIIAYIFQPTIIVTFMWLMLIATTALWAGLSGWPLLVEEYGLTITNTGAEHATFYLETQGDLFDNIGDQSKWIFKNLIMMWLIFAMLLGIIVLSAALLKIDFIKNIAWSLGKTIASIPMIPVWSAGIAGNKILKDTVGVDLRWANAGKLDIRGENRIREILGMDKLNTSADDAALRGIKASIGDRTSFSNKFSQWWAGRDEKGVILTGNNQTPQVEKIIEDFIKKHAGDHWLSPLTTEEKESLNLEEYLSKDRNRIRLYNILAGNTKTDTPIPDAMNISSAKDLLTKRLTFPQKEKKKEEDI